MPERKIVGGITQSGKLYRAGDEEAFAKVMKGKSLDRLIEKGVIVGDWGTSKKSSKSEVELEENEEYVEEEEKPTKKTKKGKKKK